jgi:lipoate-protein ligase A
MICSEGCAKEQAVVLECRIDPFRTGSRNMSIDWELLQRAETSPGPATWVRLYGWHPPAVSIGRHQDLKTAVAAQLCAWQGIEVVRRPTGGRAVFHDRELTYAVVSNDPVLVGGGITAAYRRVAEALQAGLRAVGVETRIARGEPASEELGPGSHPCFASASRHELLAQGRKIAGSAQRRLRRAFLQHGSIPLQIDYPLMADVLGCSEKFLRRRMISVTEAAGRQVSFRELAESLQAAFRDRFGSGTG